MPGKGRAALKEARKNAGMTQQQVAVVFSVGTHHYEGAYGSATVHVPRDVTLGDIEPALTNFVREAWGEKEKEAEDAA